jgi:hypothetical protein
VNKIYNIQNIYIYINYTNIHSMSFAAAGPVGAIESTANATTTSVHNTNHHNNHEPPTTTLCGKLLR